LRVEDAGGQAHERVRVGSLEQRMPDGLPSQLCNLALYLLSFLRQLDAETNAVFDNKKSNE
jgi:hypothetical protein